MTPTRRPAPSDTRYMRMGGGLRLHRRQCRVWCRGALWSLVDHGVGVIDAHAVGAGVLAHDGHHGVVSIPAGPVALPLQQDLLPGHGHDAGLDHALHGMVVRLLLPPEDATWSAASTDRAR